MLRTVVRDSFLAEQQLSKAVITPLAPDASTRCYFRVHHEGRSMMLMDAPLETESCIEFVKVSRYLSVLGARVPKIIAQDESRGFILLEDLGNQTMTWLLNQGADEYKLYRAAIDSLITIQLAFPTHQAEIALPSYDLSEILREARLFIDWYLPTRLERVLSNQENSEFIDIWTTLYNNLPSHKSVLVHRDFHVDNLIMVDNQCAMLDYQDALIGTPVYDLMSLVEDARRDISPSLKAEMISQWRNSLLINDSSFEQLYAFWAAQRHCKVAGIFVRLWLRDGKSQYLIHLPRVMKLLERHLDTNAMQPLRRWLENILPEAIHKPLSKDIDRLRRYISSEID